MTPIVIRTIRPSDRGMERDFVRGLSPESRYLRFQNVVTDLRESMLDRFVKPDYPDEMALVAVVGDRVDPRQIGVARFARDGAPDSAEIALAVADDWHGRGVGTALLRELRETARVAGIRNLVARILPENHRMRRLARHLGFASVPARSGEGLVELGKSIE